MLNGFKSKLDYSLGKLIPIKIIISDLELNPQTLLIELTNICNANCIYCGYSSMKREKGVMGTDIFKQLIDEFDGRGGGNINLTGIVGEPLIDSDLIDKIKYARTKGNIRNIKVSTNGILLEKIGIEKMLESGIDSILINIGGMDSKTYTRLFGLDAFCMVYENIKNLLVSNRLKGNRVVLTVVIKIVSTNEVLRSKNYLKLKDAAGRCNAKIIFDSTYDSWGGRISDDNMIGEMKLKRSRKKEECCSLLFNTLTVTWNADVVPCCRDIDGAIVLGNIMEQSIDEIWRGDRIKDLRKSFTEGNISPMCSRCGHYEGLKPLKSFHLLKQTLKRRGYLKRSKFTQEKAKKEQETF